MNRADVVRAAWIHGWRLFGRYHRYEVRGFEHLQGDRPVMIVGYHGRPLAWDLCILTSEFHRRLGYLPHGIVHSMFSSGDVGREVLDALGFVDSDGGALDQAVARGEHLLVAPGGTRECARSFRDRYRVDWGRRMGYLKLARRLGLDLVPVGASGVDDLYLSLLNGPVWGKKLGLPSRLPLWVALGPTGFWPLTPAFPVRIRQRIGPPVPVGVQGDGADLEALHLRVQAAVQRQLDLARAS